jgi:hypothetical protein
LYYDTYTTYGTFVVENEDLTILTGFTGIMFVFNVIVLVILLAVGLTTISDSNGTNIIKKFFNYKLFNIKKKLPC